MPPEIQKKLYTAATKDVQELLPHLLGRCELLEKRAAEKLNERGEREAKEMVAILEGQRVRIERELTKTREPQLSLAFKDWADDEQRQLEDNAKCWEQRLAKLVGEVAQEPDRIRTSYRVRVRRFEPVGIAYLWPVTG